MVHLVDNAYNLVSFSHLRVPEWIARVQNRYLTQTTTGPNNYCNRPKPASFSKFLCLVVSSSIFNYGWPLNSCHGDLGLIRIHYNHQYDH